MIEPVARNPHSRLSRPEFGCVVSWTYKAGRTFRCTGPLHVRCSMTVSLCARPVS